MAQGGEFAFVLYSAAAAAGIIDGADQRHPDRHRHPVDGADAAGVMALMRCLTPRDEQSLDGVDDADGLTGSVLIIGFGRFGQVASQPLLRAASTSRSSTPTSR